MNKLFSDLGSTDYNKKEIALNYILANFPDTLSTEQLQFIKKYISVSNVSMPLLDLLSEQPASSTLTSIMKNMVVNKNPQLEYAWEYLFKHDRYINLPFVESIIKSHPNYWQNYQNVTRIAMEEGSHFCSDLLNDKQLISFLLSAQNNKNESSEAHKWVRSIIELKPQNSKYKNTYFNKEISE